MAEFFKEPIVIGRIHSKCKRLNWNGQITKETNKNKSNLMRPKIKIFSVCSIGRFL